AKRVTQVVAPRPGGLGEEHGHPGGDLWRGHRRTAPAAVTGFAGYGPALAPRALARADQLERRLAGLRRQRRPDRLSGGAQPDVRATAGEGRDAITDIGSADGDDPGNGRRIADWAVRAPLVAHCRHDRAVVLLQCSEHVRLLLGRQRAATDAE